VVDVFAGSIQQHAQTPIAEAWPLMRELNQRLA
jgi:hypothetical protein